VTVAWYVAKYAPLVIYHPFFNGLNQYSLFYVFFLGNFQGIGCSLAFICSITFTIVVVGCVAGYWGLWFLVYFIIEPM
jgi:hypothetical protein